MSKNNAFGKFVLFCAAAGAAAALFRLADAAGAVAEPRFRHPAGAGPGDPPAGPYRLPSGGEYRDGHLPPGGLFRADRSGAARPAYFPGCAVAGDA